MRALALGATLVLALGACTEAANDDDDAAGDGTFEIDAIVSEVIPTVITVEWSAEIEAIEDAYVEFGPDDSYGRVAPADLSGGAPFETVLLGSKPTSDVHFRVVVVADGETAVSEDVSVTTGSVPTALPGATAETMGDVDDGFIVTSIFAGSPAAVILDRDGDYVWWYEAPSDDFNVSRTSMTADGQHVLFWSVNLSRQPGEGDQADQELFRVSLDGTQVDRRSEEDGHHDFVAMPDGGVTIIEYDVRDGEEGDRLVEISPSGEETVVWSVWDDFTNEGGSGGIGTTFSHINAIDYYEDEDAYYVSSLGFEGLFKVDRGSGELQWTMGGDESDFSLSGGSTDLFDKNHQFHRLDETLLVFVNSDEDTACSEAREYAYDEGSGEAELVWSYVPDPCVYTFSLGDASRLDSGNTLMTFSNQGQIDEVNEAGDVVWQLYADLGGALGYATFLEDLYPVQ